MVDRQEKTTFTTFDVLKLFNIKRNRLQPWLDAGFVVPSIRKSTRKGDKNLFSRNDLYRIRLFILLLEAGMTRKEASLQSLIRFDGLSKGARSADYRIYKMKKPQSVAHPSEKKTVYERGEGYYSEKPPVIDLKKKELFAVVINIRAVKDEVDAILDRFYDN